MTRRRVPRTAIPVGTQFTPDLIDLQSFVLALVRESGDKAAIEDAVWTAGVRRRAKKGPLTHRTKSLPVEAAVQYGLLSSDYQASELAKRLSKLTGPILYETFARHILLECGGLRVLEGIEQMRVDNRKVTGDTLARYLTDQGFPVAEHNTAINSLRMWLEVGGVFISGKGADYWRIAPGARERLLGLKDDNIAILSGLAPHQLAYVEALCAAAPQKTYLASSIRDLAAVRNPSVSFDRGSLPNDVLSPLKAAGIIDFEAKGTKSGKSSVLWTTEIFDRQILSVFVTKTVKDLDAVVSGYYSKRPADIYRELDSRENTVKGRALEALAIRVMRLIGLRFVAWNNRAADTGYGEVDAVLAGVFGALPTRWQIQCKNTPGSQRADLEDIAKEVGLTPITRATHILFLANNDFTSEARKFVQQVMHSSALTIFLLGRKEFGDLRKEDAALGRILLSQAQEIVRKVPRDSVFSWK